MEAGGGTTYYDGQMESSVRYRHDASGQELMPVHGWRRAYNSFTGLSLRVTDETIEVRDLGAFGRLFGLELSLKPRETTMTTLSLGRILIGGTPLPRPLVDFVALTRVRDDGSSYTIALRPRDGDLDRIREALRASGVREDE